jgi:hypothetical protein
MIPNQERPKRVENKKADVGKIKCSNCNRELKFSSNWIDDHDHILCEACYQNLVFPFLNDGYDLKQN